METLNDESDIYYVQKMLIPYLSSVYYGLTAHGGAKDYLTASKTQLYLNLPDVIARRVVA